MLSITHHISLHLRDGPDDVVTHRPVSYCAAEEEEVPGLETVQAGVFAGEPGGVIEFVPPWIDGVRAIKVSVSMS
jgi:hypothetical protein